VSGLVFVVTVQQLNRRTRQRTGDPQPVRVTAAADSVFANCRTAEQVRQAYETFANETDERTPEVAEVLQVQTYVPVCAWCPDAAELTAAARGAGFDVTHVMCWSCAQRMEQQVSSGQGGRP
jgi:3-methyladenine DNA glycosylase Tag